MSSLVNSLNSIALHCGHCKKCKKYKEKGWILDSGASSHFTMQQSDFVDFEVVKDAEPVKTAAAKNPLKIEGVGTVLLSHKVKIKDKRVSHYT